MIQFLLTGRLELMRCILLLLKAILRLPRYFCELEWQLMRLFA